MRHLLDGPSAGLFVAVAFWGYTHFIAHFGIAIGYGVAMTRNNSVINQLMRLSPWTKIAGAGFFLFCGVTHIGLATGTSTSPVVTATDHLQLLSIWVFLIGLLLDSRRVVLRLSNSFNAIREEFDGLAVVPGKRGRDMIAAGEADELQVADTVIASINFALHGRGDTPPRGGAGKVE